jgi:hypothetical protein
MGHKVNVFTQSDDVAIVGGGVLEEDMVYGVILLILALKIGLVRPEIMSVTYEGQAKDCQGLTMGHGESYFAKQAWKLLVWQPSPKM